jgi:RNA polymerase sigma-70 factor, ECF subfamily
MNATSINATQANMLAEERGFLLRLARMQLQSSAEAEDVVQETLLAALNGFHSFSGHVNLRAWLLGIMRHKIIDTMRARKFLVSLEEFALDGDDGALDHLFTHANAWNPNTFHSHQSPESCAAQQNLLDIVQLCLNRLHGITGQLFLQREYLGLDLSEIANYAQISQATLRVQLYRARMRLRECVVRSWGEVL